MTSSVARFAKTVVKAVGLDCNRAVLQITRTPDPPMVARVVGLARVSIANLYKSTLICSIPVLMVVVAACGGNPQEPISDEPVSARVIVTDVGVSTDGDRVDSITVRTDDGRELFMRLSDDIDPVMWGPPHLQSHQGLGESLGLKIGVTYMQTPEGIVATALSE